MARVKQRPTLWMSSIDWAPLLPALVLVWRVGSILAKRRTHPFDLEWMEGGMLVHALRLSRGQPLYTDASVEWLPYVYPPGFAALVAAGSSLVPLDYALGRTVSLAGLLVALCGIVAFGVRSGQLAAGLFGAAVFLGTYPDSGAFFDLVRPDSVAAASLTWTLYLASDRRPGTGVAAGLVLAAGFLVKHHLAALGLPIALFLWARDDWRRALSFGLSAALPAGAAALCLELRSGHFVDYLLRVPGVHPHDFVRLVPGTPGELAVALPAVLLFALGSVGWWSFGTLSRGARAALLVVAMVSIGGSLGLALRTGDIPGVAEPTPLVTGLVVAAFFGTGAAVAIAAVDRWWAGAAFDRPMVGAALVGGAIVVVAGVMRSHNGGFLNVLMPAHLALSLSIPVLASRWQGTAGRLAFSALMTGQLVWAASRIDAEQLEPTAADVEAGNRLLATIRTECDGEVFSPYAPWLVYQLGGEPGFQLIALWDLAHKATPIPFAPKLVAEAAKAHRWSCVIRGSRPLGFGVDAEYTELIQVPMVRLAMMPKTGWRVRPSVIARPRAKAPELP